RFSILAQDKTQFRRVTVLIFRIRNTSASAHTNYLVNFLKSSGNSRSLIKAAYSTANRFLVNRYFAPQNRLMTSLRHIG
ncbi:hypothetical protein, partial [Marinobacter sp. CHS3-4]|uniref:hypothetical protein n=1 Tax=Marinobacter sp. CHS3-4 TaxID=3045174 RepID=UPI0024B5A5AD